LKKVYLKKHWKIRGSDKNNNLSLGHPEKNECFLRALIECALKDFERILKGV